MIYVDLSEDEERLVLATLDPIAALATSDDGALQGLIEGLSVDSAGLQRLVDDLKVKVERASGGDNDPDAVPDTPDEPTTKPGDVYQLGNHRLMCGDCRNVEHVAVLFGDAKATGVFTSPPYAQQREKQYGGIPATHYVEWFEAVQACARKWLTDDGSMFVNIKPHTDQGERSLYVVDLVVDLVVAMARRWEWSYVDEFCWLRSGVPRKVKYSFKNGFEPVFHFANARKGFKFRPSRVRHESDAVPVPGGPGVGETNWAGKQGHSKSTAPGGKGRPAQDLQGNESWIFGGQEYAPGKAYPSNVLKSFSNDVCRGHEAAFPTQLPLFFVEAYSDPDDAWFDPFIGSGTTMIACHMADRVCFGMEVEPRYCDVAVRRWEEFTGESAELIRPV